MATTRHKDKLRFYQHKANSKKRGIGFNFTFEEWKTWWIKHLGQDWLSKRGHCKGQFVMARIADKGAYESSNVKCILATKNISDKCINGTASRGDGHPRAKISPRDVIAIRKSNKSQKELGRKYQLNQSTIGHIRTYRTWKHLD